MKHILSFFIIILIPLTIFGQSKALKISVYFESDNFILSADAKKTIEYAIDNLSRRDIHKISVTGNTDNTADSLYNLNLSNKRTEHVKNYLIEKGIKSDIIKTTYFGESKPIADNSLEEGKQKNRRVDIIFYYRQKTTQPEAKADSFTGEISMLDTCSADTLITLSAGTQLIFNRCEYLEIKDCLSFTETVNSDAISYNGLSLMDTRGSPLASCGMLLITMKPGCTESECFRIPVKVRFPVPINNDCDYCRRNAGVWDISSDGGWTQEQGKNNVVRKVRVQGELFYEFKIYCPNKWKNCDCKLPKGKKVKFKTKRGYQLANVKVTSDCPTAVIELTSKRRTNIAKEKIPCLLGDKAVTAMIIESMGDTLTLAKMPLNDLPKRTAFSRCKRTKKHIKDYHSGIPPAADRLLYRKYSIKSSALQPKL
jgi:hypothetical protein